jgi:hypothetical protein
VKPYEVRLYTHNGALREIETSQEKSEIDFGGHAVLIKKL